MSVSAATTQETGGQNARGCILTFYSYKGGTGRSMALANVAWMLALNNKRVLVIDWDLEAPGVHRYFHPFLDDKELQSTRGLIDFVEDLAARSAASPEPLPDSEGDVSSYVISLDRPGWNWEEFGERAGIDLLAAGQQSAGYSRKVNCFNWISFYQSLGGRRFLAYMAAQLRGIYDYILIDSRTGVSDTSGICTVEMPDAVVVCFTLNEQSIRGAANVSESILFQRNARDEERKLQLKPDEAPPAPLRIYPVPTRIEQSEYNKRQIALALVQKTFSRYLVDLSAAESKKYWGNLQMQYVPIYAFEEVPAVFGDSPYDQSSLSAFIGRLTRTLANDNSFSLQFLADDIRLQVFGWYQRSSEVALDSAQLAEAALDQFGQDLQREAIRVLLRLVQITPSGFSPQVLARNELQRGLSDATDALIKTRVLKSVGTQSGQALQLADSAILQTWPAYMNWIKEDLPFLQWRQSISTAARSWSLASRRESGLLRDDSLEEARNYLQLRADELNEDERQYISASVEWDDRRRTFEELSRVNQEAMKAEVARLQEQLSAAKDPKSRFFTPMRLVVGFLGLFLVMIAGMFWIESLKQDEQKASQREQLARAQQQQAQLAATLANLQKQLALANESNLSLMKELAARGGSAGASNSGTTIPKRGTKPLGSAPPVKNLLNAPPSSVGTGSTDQATCHIMPRKPGGLIVPVLLSISVDGLPVGSISFGENGSNTGLDFACSPGYHSLVMELEGTACGKVKFHVMTGTNLYDAYYSSSSKGTKCALEPVAAK